jgi:hypothetical protein
MLRAALALSLTLPLLFAAPLWAGEPRELAWSEMAPVVKALHGQQVKLPGYIVPLNSSEEGRVTEFLLVPYYGACIHVPPPPPNQIVHVKTELGVLMENLYQPFWIEGPLQVESISSDIAEAGYQMQASKVYPYESPEN